MADFPQNEAAVIRLNEGERIDDTGFGGIRIIQGKGFSYGVDAVLLAWFASESLNGRRRAKASGTLRICDLGTGNGAIPLILSHKVGSCKCMGIEIDPSACSRAERSVSLNSLEDRVRILNADINDVYESIMLDRKASRESIEGSFDAVVTNPPYFRRGAAILSEADDRAMARHEVTAGLDDFLALAAVLLHDQGDFYMIHRPSRLADIVCGMRDNGLEPKELRFVSPRQGEAPNLVLVHGVKGAGPGVQLFPEISVHGDGQSYTDMIEMIYERQL